MITEVQPWSLTLREEYAAQAPTAVFPVTEQHLTISAAGVPILKPTQRLDQTGVLQEEPVVLTTVQVSGQTQVITAGATIPHFLIMEDHALLILTVEAVISQAVAEAGAVAVLVEVPPQV
jgi:hypothetical protein